MPRFDYVKYDNLSQAAQALAKEKSQELEKVIEAFPNGRAKSLALTKLEEVYMWIGKMIRDEQILRDGAHKILQEERTNS